MPNFEIGGIDVRAEPTFTGFARQAKERLDVIEGQIEPFNVLAEPKLVKDFKARLRALVDKAQAGVRFDVEFAPKLIKGFKADLRALVDKAQSGVRFNIEFSPKLTKGFKVDLKTLATKAQTGVRYDIEFSPALIKGFRTDLRAMVDKSQTDLRMRIEAKPELAAGFRTELREKVKSATEFAASAVEIVPKLAPGFRSELRAKIAEGGEVPVNARLSFNKLQLRTQMKEQIQAAADGIRIRIHVDLDPDIAAFRAKMAAAERANASRFKMRINADTTGIGSQLKAGLGSAVAGVKKLANIPVRIATVGAAALAPVVKTLQVMGNLAKTTAKGFGLLSLGILAAGAGGVKQAGDMEYQQRALNIILKSNTEGARVFAAVLDLAAKTPFQVPDLTPTVKQLRLAGIETKNLVPDLKSLADLTAALGREGPNMQGVAVALSKIFGKGVVDMRQLNAITQQLPGFSAVKAIADSLGKTVPQTFELIKNKAVSAQVGIAAIVDGFKTQLPQAVGFAEKAATETFKGALSNFPDLLRITFYRSFRTALPAITAILGPNGQLIKTIESLLKPLAVAFVPLVQAVLGAVQGLAPALGALVGSALPLMTALGRSVQALSPALTLLAKSLGLVFGPLAVVLPGIIRSLNTVFTAVLSAGRPAFMALGTAMAVFATALGQALEVLAPVIPLFVKLGAVIVTALAGVLPLLAGALLPAITALAPAAYALVTAVGKLLGALTPLIPVFATIVAKVVTALLPAFDSLSDPAFVAALVSLATSFGNILIAVAPLIPLLVAIAIPLIKIAAFQPVLDLLVAGFIAFKVATALAATYTFLFGTAMEQAAVAEAAATGADVIHAGALGALAATYKSVVAGATALIGTSPAVDAALATETVGAEAATVAFEQLTLAFGEASAAGELTAVTQLSLGFEEVGIAAAAATAPVEGLAAAMTLSVGAIALIAAAIVAVVAGLVLLYFHCKPVRDIVDAIANKVGFLKGALILLGGPIGLVAAGVLALYQNCKPVRDVLDAIGRAAKRVGVDLLGAAKAVGRFFTDIPGHLADAGHAVGQFFTDLPGRIGRALVRFGPDLAKFLEQAAGVAITAFLLSFVALPLGIYRVLKRFGPDLVQWAKDAFWGLYDVGVNAVQAFVRFWQLFPGRLVNALARFGPDLKVAAHGAFWGVYDVGVNAVQAFVRFWQLFPGRLVHALVATGPALKRWATTAFWGIYDVGVNAIQATVRAFVRFGPDIINGIGRGLKNGAVAVWHAIVRIARSAVDAFKWFFGISSPSSVMERLGRDVIQGLINGLGALGLTVLQFFADLPGKMIRAAGAVGNLFFGLGKRMIEGLWHGILSLKDSIVGAAKTVGGWFTSAYKFVMNQKSPSLVMYKLGKDSVVGLINGYNTGIPAASAAGEALGKALRDHTLAELTRPLTAAEKSAANKWFVGAVSGSGVSGPPSPAFSRANAADQQKAFRAFHPGTFSGPPRPDGSIPGQAKALRDAYNAFHPVTGPPRPDGTVGGKAYLGLPDPDAVKRRIAALQAAFKAFHPDVKTPKATVFFPNDATMRAQAAATKRELDTAYRAMHASTASGATASATRLLAIARTQREKLLGEATNTRTGTVSESTKTHTALVSSADTNRAQLGVRATALRNRLLGEWTTTSKGSVGRVDGMHRTISAHTGKAFGTLEGQALRGGTGFGTHLNKGLGSQVRPTLSTANRYAIGIVGALNPVLTGIGEKPIRLTNAGKLGQSLASLGLNTGGVIPLVPGSVPHRDSVLAHLTPNEYVTKESRVREEGVEKFHALNEGRATIVLKKYLPPDLPRFADGGMVQSLAGGGAVTGLNPEFLRRFQAWTAALGNKFSIGSGWRSSAQQAVLYNRWIHHVPGQAKAAAPGHSMHEFGLAIDHVPSTHNAADAAMATKMKLYYPMSFEPWHIQPIGIGKSGAVAGGVSPGGGIPASVQLPKPPPLDDKLGKMWVQHVANAAMNKVYLAAQAFADAHTTQNEPTPAGGSAAASAVSSFFGAASGGLLGRVMAAIRQHESRGNYRAYNPHGGAAGAYQVLPGTWGGYAGFASARDAPPGVQDRFAASRMGPVLAAWHNDPGAVAAFWYTGQASRMNDHGIPGSHNTQSVYDYAQYIRALSQHIAGVPGYAKGGKVAKFEHGGIIRHEDVVRVAEGNKPEVIIPLTQPDRARQLSDESGLTRLVSQDKGIRIDSVVVQVTPPESQSPESYGSSIAHRMTPALAAALQRALG